MSAFGILAIGFTMVWFVSRSYFFFKQKRTYLSFTVIALAVGLIAVFGDTLYHLIAWNSLRTYLFLFIGILLGLWNAYVIKDSISGGISQSEYR